LVRSASPREPNIRPDFLPRQSGVTRPLPGQKVGQLAVTHINKNDKQPLLYPSTVIHHFMQNTVCNFIPKP